MVHEEYKEMLAPHALDALDTTDARAFEDHLRGCVLCGTQHTPSDDLRKLARRWYRARRAHAAPAFLCTLRGPSRFRNLADSSSPALDLISQEFAQPDHSGTHS